MIVNNTEKNNPTHPKYLDRVGLSAKFGSSSFDFLIRYKEKYASPTRKK
jgi:hypothetical protein